jgi:hypothetical protein
MVRVRVKGRVRVADTVKSMARIMDRVDDVVGVKDKARFRVRVTVELLC